MKSLATRRRPVWVAKPNLFHDFGLTGPSRTSTTASRPPGTHDHRARRTRWPPAQRHRRVPERQSLSWGKPTASATTIARAGTDAAIFDVESGVTLSTGNAAPACRLTFPLYTNGPTALTAIGLAMFEAAANWAAAGCTDASRSTRRRSP